MIKEYSEPKEGSKPIHFDTPYSRSTWKQFLLLLRKFNIIWWRTPEYNATRIFFTVIFAFVVSRYIPGVTKPCKGIAPPFVIQALPRQLHRT